MARSMDAYVGSPAEPADPKAAARAAHASQGALAHSRRRSILWPLYWYLEWALPGLGMFSEAYIIFSAGQIKPLQQGLYPTCFNSNTKLITDCDPNMINHLASYIQICGIIAGMLLWGYIGDITGRKWGSRLVASIMLSGCILLVFTPYAGSPYSYLVYFLTAQTWYGFGVGGEYPMAASSAAERASVKPELRAYRGRQVVLVFSNQGMGNFINGVVIVIAMAIFGQTGPQRELTFTGCRSALALMYGFGAVACLVMVWYRYTYLKESQMFSEVVTIESTLESEKAKAMQKHKPPTFWRKHAVTWWYWGHRQMVASAAWVANDFAFYGNKLQQSLFLALLFPTATPYKQLQWSILNSFISLLGYYAAAAIIDKRWYGRRRMQNVGFLAMFVFYITIYAQWPRLGAPGATKAGAQTFQALYYLSSFFNQFGPNCTTWLVAGEIFPTDIRATMHGIAAAMGKVGAIISALWISYVSDRRKVFLISAIWGIAGAVVTWIWLPDTTGMELEEYDRMQRYMLEGRFQDYHGEAINPRYLSPWEIYVLGWHKQYNPTLDRRQFEGEIRRLSRVPEALHELGRMSVLPHETIERISSNTGHTSDDAAAEPAGAPHAK